MAEIIKFDEKVVNLYSVIETVPGTYQTGILASDVIQATALTGSVTVATSDLTFRGSNKTRKAYTYQTDSSADISVETPDQVLGVLNPSLTVAAAPLSDYMRACGARTVIDGSTGVVTYDNSLAVADKLSFDFRKTSDQDLANDKVVSFYGCVGTADLTADVKDLPKWKFNLKGNALDEYQSPTIIPDFGAQDTLVAPVIKMASIVTAQVAQLDGTFTAVTASVASATLTRASNIATFTATGIGTELGAIGSIRAVRVGGATDPLYNGTFLAQITGANTFTYLMNAVPAANAVITATLSKGPAAKNFCFGKVSASNFFGRELSRYVLGCEEGYRTPPVPSDVSITMIENKAAKVMLTSLVGASTTATATCLGHGLQVGDSVTISGAGGAGAASFNVTATVLTSTAVGATAIALNAASGTTNYNDTFTYTIASYTGSATGTPAAFNNSTVTFNPDSFMTKFFGLKLTFGTGPARYNSYVWSSLQIADVKEDKLEGYFARNVTFKNTGYSMNIKA